MNTFSKPTEAELDILSILWQNGATTVRVVNDELNRQSHVRGGGDVGYTTTLKIMQIMTEKHLVHRDESSRTHIYHANVKESDIQQNLVEKLVDSAFRGSAMKLVMQALGHSQTSKQELDEIRKLLDQKEYEQQHSISNAQKGRKS